MIRYNSRVRESSQDDMCQNNKNTGAKTTYWIKYFLERAETAKAISGKIEWLASHGSLLRLDAISLGLSMDQKSPSVVVPSQKRAQKELK